MQSILAPIIGPAGPEVADLTGKVAVVTGGSAGIGFEIAKFFALYGAKVYLVSKTKEHGDEAIQKINEEAEKQGKKVEKVEWVECDTGSLKNVKQAVKGLASKLNRLDILILSAGINGQQFQTDEDGVELVFGVNALGSYYTMNLLYPLMAKTAAMPDTPKGSVRIVFESSEMHRFAPGSEDSKSRGRGCHFGSEAEITEDAKDYGPIEFYARTKLAMILYGKALRDKVIKKNGDDVYILSVHPGAVNTDIQNQWEEAYPGILGSLMKGLSVAISRNPEQGSYSGLYAALSPDVVKNDWNGVYLTDPAQLGKETAQAEDLNLATALWELSERMVKRIVGDDALEKWSK